MDKSDGEQGGIINKTGGYWWWPCRTHGGRGVKPARGVQVDLFDAMPSVGRKFLQAGKGGMNIPTLKRFPILSSKSLSASSAEMLPLLQAFDANALRQWSHELGFDTFVGSSGRVFPTDMRAAPCCVLGCNVCANQG